MFVSILAGSCQLAQRKIHTKQAQEEQQHCCSGGCSPRAGEAVAAAEPHCCWGNSIEGAAVASCVMSCWDGGKIEVLGVGGRPESFGELGRGRLSLG